MLAEERRCKRDTLLHPGAASMQLHGWVVGAPLPAALPVPLSSLSELSLKSLALACRLRPSLQPPSRRVMAEHRVSSYEASWPQVRK
jgi:hypothetical protein